jgi:hypothetical protein
MGTSISTRCLSEAEIKAAHRAKMLQVAEHFVKSVPPWLPDVLSDWSFEVRSQSSIDAIWPTKREMWDSLAHAGDLALQLSDALKQVGVAGFLATNSEAKSEQILEDLAAQLSEFAGFAAQARNSPQLVGDDGEILPGAGKPLSAGVMPAKYVCAAIIAEVISFFRQQGNPEPTKQDTRAAADPFWTSWSAHKGWGNDPRTVWKRYFEAADDPRLAPFRKQVRRQLNIRSARAIHRT